MVSVAGDHRDVGVLRRSFEYFDSVDRRCKPPHRISACEVTHHCYVKKDRPRKRLAHSMSSAVLTSSSKSPLDKLHKNRDVTDVVFLIDSADRLQASLHRRGFVYRYERHGQRNSIRYMFKDIKPTRLLIGSEPPNRILLKHDIRSTHTVKINLSEQCRSFVENRDNAHNNRS